MAFLLFFLSRFYKFIFKLYIKFFNFFLILFQYFIEKKIIFFQSKFQKKYLLYFIPVFIPFILTSDHGRNLAFLSFYLVTFFSVLKLDILKFKK